MSAIIDNARKQRTIMEQLSAGMDDQTASKSVMMAQRLRGNGALVKAGTRINWNGELKRAAVDLWDTFENTPENAPTLWESVMYKDGVRIIPETITVGLAFAKGETGWWHDQIYVSLIDANVWTPEQYPAGWEKK